MRDKIIKKVGKNGKKGNQIDFGEIYRQLRATLEYSSFEKNLQVINLTSTNPSEGKSTVASNLAKICVSKYKSVLLIDCDLRKPVLHKLFQTTNVLGLSDLLKNLSSFDLFEDAYFQKFRDEKSNGNLYVLTAGTRVPNPQELLESDKYKELITRLKARFDLIIIDCPPISAVADAIPVSNLSDGTLFVISSKETSKHDAKTALVQLQRNGAHVLGSILTKVENVSSHYYNYYAEE